MMERIIWQMMHNDSFRARMRSIAVRRHMKQMWRLHCQGRFTVEVARAHIQCIVEYYDEWGWWWDGIGPGWHGGAKGGDREIEI